MSSELRRRRILLSALIYSKPVEEINRILNIITKKAKTIIRPNRSNPRKTIRPPSVFYKAKKTNEIEATDPNKPTKWCKRPKNMVKKKEPVTSIKLKPKKDCNKSPKKSTNLAPLKAHKKLSNSPSAKL